MCSLITVCKRWNVLMIRFWRQLNTLWLPKLHETKSLALAKRCQNVRHLVVYCEMICSKGAQSLAELCPLVESLELILGSDETIDCLVRNFPNLKKISLGCLLKAKHFDTLFAYHPKLVHLECEIRILDGKWLRFFCSPLTHFHVNHIIHEPSVMHALVQHCKHSLKSLAIGQIDDENMVSFFYKQIFTQFPNLTDLSLVVKRSNHLNGLPCLPQLKKLSLRIIWHMDFDVDDAKNIVDNLVCFLKSVPNLTSLNLTDLWSDDETLLKAIASTLVDLQSLNFEYFEFRDQNWMSLLGLKKLECFTCYSIRNVEICCQFVKEFVSLKKLKVFGSYDLIDWQNFLSEFHQELIEANFDRKLIVESNKFKHELLDVQFVSETCLKTILTV